MKSSEVAYKAAQVIMERGHCKHELADGQGRVCLLGALNTVMTGDPLHAAGNWRKYFAILHVLESQIPNTGIFSAINFNNDENTTGEDVILLLKKTVELLKEQERAGEDRR